MREPFIVQAFAYPSANTPDLEATFRTFKQAGDFAKLLLKSCSIAAYNGDKFEMCEIHKYIKIVTPSGVVMSEVYPDGYVEGQQLDKEVAY